MKPKFRAWDTFHNKWINHFYITENGLIYDMGRQHRNLIGAVPIEKSGLIVMQSTGVKDKEGTEVFECDVVEDEGCRRYVVKKNREFSAFFLYPCDNSEEFMAFYPGIILRVIGNVYANPYLLEGLNGE